MARFREVRPRDRWITGALVAAACALIVTAALKIDDWGAAPFFAVTAIALAALVTWHARGFGYECPHCGERFQIGSVTDFLSPHTFSTKYLRCPRCGTRDWARVLAAIRE